MAVDVVTLVTFNVNWTFTLEIRDISSYLYVIACRDPFDELPIEKYFKLNVGVITVAGITEPDTLQETWRFITEFHDRWTIHIRIKLQTITLLIKEHQGPIRIGVGE